MEREKLFIKKGKRYKEWGVIMEDPRMMPVGDHIINIESGLVRINYNVKAATPELRLGKVALGKFIEDFCMANKGLSIAEFSCGLANALMEMKHD